MSHWRFFTVKHLGVKSTVNFTSKPTPPPPNSRTISMRNEIWLQRAQNKPQKGLFCSIGRIFSAKKLILHYIQTSKMNFGSALVRSKISSHLYFSFLTKANIHLDLNEKLKLHFSRKNRDGLQSVLFALGPDKQCIKGAKTCKMHFHFRSLLETLFQM